MKKRLPKLVRQSPLLLQIYEIFRPKARNVKIGSGAPDRPYIPRRNPLRRHVPFQRGTPVAVSLFGRAFARRSPDGIQSHAPCGVRCRDREKNSRHRPDPAGYEPLSSGIGQARVRKCKGGTAGEKRPDAVCHRPGSLQYEWCPGSEMFPDTIHLFSMSCRPYAISAPCVRLP